MRIKKEFDRKIEMDKSKMRNSHLMRPESLIIYLS